MLATELFHGGPSSFAYATSETLAVSGSGGQPVWKSGEREQQRIADAANTCLRIDRFNVIFPGFKMMGFGG